MAFIIKSDPQPLSTGQRILVSVKRYKAASPAAGDEVFLWHSGTAGGTGLAARGLIDAISNDNPIDLAITVTDIASRPCFGVEDLKAHRDLDDGAPIAGLAKTLYRHSLNKVAALSEDEAALLDARWMNGH